MRSLLRIFAVFYAISTSLALGSGPSRAIDQQLEELKAKGRALGWTFETGYNEVMDYPADKATGFKPDPNWREKAMFLQPKKTRATLPTKWDWRDTAHGLTPIKNQGSCGSCWAFGTVAVLESIVKIRDGVSKIFSEQQLVSCNEDGWGCNGGMFAHKYHMTPGATLDSDFPYVAEDVPCQHGALPDTKIENWAYVGSSSQSRATVDDMKQAMYQYGPLAVTVAASGSFKAYKHGIYNANDGQSINHIVAIVGWNDDEGGYWIMRNSWGARWGEEGYMRIAYDTNQIGNQATFVNYKAACTPQPIAYAGDSVTVAAGQSVRLGGMPVSDQTYSWTPAAGLDDPKSATPLATPAQTTTYTLSAMTNCGTAQKSVTVTVAGRVSKR